MIVLFAAWLIAGAAGSAAGRGLFELGIAPFWGALLAAVQGLVLWRRGVPYVRWILWSSVGWLAGVLIAARLISAAVRAVGAAAPGLGAIPLDLLPTVTVFSVFGAAQSLVLRPHLPSAFVWVIFSALAGLLMNMVESPIRVLLFAPVEASAGVVTAEAVVGGALGAIYGATMAPLMLQIGPVEAQPADSVTGIRSLRNR